MKRVLISRDAESAAPLIRLLAAKEIQGVPLQVTELKVVYSIDNLPNLADFQGMVFTSPNAVLIAAEVFAKGGISLPASLKIFTVGVATTAKIKEHFKRDADFSGREGGASMAEEIIERFGKSVSPLLWPSPLETATDLKSIFADAQIRLEKWVIYETVSKSEARMRETLKEIGNFDAVFLTAPSAVSALSQITEIMTKPSIAIGTTTAGAMKVAGWQNITVSKSPVIEDCCITIQDCLLKSKE